jgi:uncharacterized protein (DUF58 family)
MEPAAGEGLAELLREVRRIEVQSRRLVAGAMAGGWRSVFRGAGLEFDELREWTDGDDPRAVDWSVTARMGRPFVRRYGEERQLTVVFLLDVSASMSAGFGAWSARQAAARVIAALALAAIANNDKVGLIAFGQEVVRVRPPQRGAQHALSVVRDALALPSVPATADPACALDFAHRAIRHGAVAFLLSDLMAAGWQTAAARCVRRHDLVAVRFEPPEFADPPPERLLARGPAGGSAIAFDGRDHALRAAFAARVAAWRTGVSDSLRRGGVDLIEVPLPRQRDARALLRPLLRFMRMREARGAKR